MTADADALRRSPLGSTGSDPVPIVAAPGVDIRESPFTPQLTLRLDPTAAALGAAEGVLGARPGPPGEVSTNAGTSVIALAPDEWLIVGAADVAAVAGAVRPHGGTVVDVSAHRTVLELRGVAVRDLLAAGCSIDLHPRVFAVGQCAQTTLARVDVIIVRAEVDTYRVFVRTSFARYLVDWLTNALEVAT